MVAGQMEATMPLFPTPLAIARFLTPGYAFARVWSVSFPLSFGFGSQSGFSLVASPSQSHTDPMTLQSRPGGGRLKMQAYSMSPGGGSGEAIVPVTIHSCPFSALSMLVGVFVGEMEMPVMGSFPLRGWVDSCMKGESGGTYCSGLPTMSSQKVLPAE